VAVDGLVNVPLYLPSKYPVKLVTSDLYKRDDVTVCIYPLKLDEEKLPVNEPLKNACTGL
jgi:hypothetical protein